MTLTETLAARGLSHKPGIFPGVRDIVDASGAVVASGRARDVWAWLGGQPRIGPCRSPLGRCRTDDQGLPPGACSGCEWHEGGFAWTPPPTPDTPQSMEDWLEGL